MIGRYVSEMVRADRHVSLSSWLAYVSRTTVLGRAHIETQATQPMQGRAAQVSVIHTFEYVGAS